MVLSPSPRLPLPIEPPFPPLSHRRQRKGREGVGGAGLPLGTAVAQSISPKPRNFLLPKRKKKKKISQRPPFLPAPLGQSRLDLWGFPGGWLRAGTLSGKSGGVPCQALRQAHFGLLPSPLLLPLQANHQRWPSPDLRPLGWRPGRLGAGAGVPRSPEAGGLAAAWGWQARRGARPPSTLYPLPLLPQRLGISFHKLLWGHLFPSSKSLCHLLPPPPG